MNRPTRNVWGGERYRNIIHTVTQPPESLEVCPQKDIMTRHKGSTAKNDSDFDLARRIAEEKPYGRERMIIRDDPLQWDERRSWGNKVVVPSQATLRTWMSTAESPVPPAALSLPLPSPPLPPLLSALSFPSINPPPTNKICRQGAILQHSRHDVRW